MKYILRVIRDSFVPLYLKGYDFAGGFIDTHLHGTTTWTTDETEAMRFDDEEDARSIFYYTGEMTIVEVEE